MDSHNRAPDGGLAVEMGVRAWLLGMVIGVAACRVEAGIGSPVAARSEAIPLAVARSYFDEYGGLCAADNGRMWGRSLKGPFLFVDPETRQIVANERDAGGKLTASDGVFVGRLGDKDMLANTATEWSGTRWTMVMWDDDFATHPARRRSMMLHEAFHRLQPELGLVAAGEPNEHLDTRDGRYWLQLEWNALEAAVASPARAASAIADALAFRAARPARTRSRFTRVSPSTQVRARAARPTRRSSCRDVHAARGRAGSFEASRT